MSGFPYFQQLVDVPHICEKRGLLYAGSVETIFMCVSDSIMIFSVEEKSLLELLPPVEYSLWIK